MFQRPLPGLLDASFSDSLGVLKRIGSLGGLLPPMLILWTWTMYSVSSSRSHSAHERVVVFTSWMNLNMRTSFFCRWARNKRSEEEEAQFRVILKFYFLWHLLSWEVNGLGLQWHSTPLSDILILGWYCFWGLFNTQRTNLWGKMQKSEDSIGNK